MAPQEQPQSNHSRSSHPSTALCATRLTGSGGILAAGSASPASLNPPESRQTDAPDARFDHAAGVIIDRKTYRLPVPDRRRGP
jgi:hypothetical protein